MPYYPQKSESKVNHGYFVQTAEEKSVADYCNISILDVGELNVFDYMLYRRDARIYNLSQTEDGQEYLENAWRITQTAPERTRLRDKYGTDKEGTN